jgi:membrane protein YqaA with SNARE-associated domain
MHGKPTTSDIEARYAQQRAQEGYFTSTRSTVPSQQDKEPLALKYARQTGNATVFIAWVVAIGILFSVIAGLVIGIQIAHSVNNSSIGGGGTSNCLSQGGYDPSC